jgi:hypothetical protein
LRDFRRLGDFIVLVEGLIDSLIGVDGTRPARQLRRWRRHALLGVGRRDCEAELQETLNSRPRIVEVGRLDGEADPPRM